MLTLPQPTGLRRVRITVRKPRGQIDQRCGGCRKDLKANGPRYKGNLAFVHTYESDEWKSTEVFHEQCLEAP